MTRPVRIAPDYIEEEMTQLSVFTALPAHLSVQYDLPDAYQRQTLLRTSPTTELPE
jgi:hypothetical protein